MLDEIISWAGAHYDTIHAIRWIVWIGVVLAVGFAILLFLKRKALAWRGFALLLMLSAAAIGSMTRFVSGYYSELLIPADYSKIEVSFSAVGNRIAGELLLPNTKTKVPAVIFVSGSDISSYRTNYALMVNQVLTPLLAELGFAVLYYDKRGIGQSSGKWWSASIADRGEEAKSAIGFLASRPEIDPRRIFVIGHSQGGWIAQIVAVDPGQVAGVVSLAGPTVSVEEQIVDDEVSGLVCNGMTRDQARVEATRLISELRGASANATSGRLRHFRSIIAYRPDQAIQNIRTRALFLFAANDGLVPAKANRARLHALLGDRLPPNIRVEVVPGAGHSFRMMGSCAEDSSAAFSPELGGRIAEFLKATAAQ